MTRRNTNERNERKIFPRRDEEVKIFRKPRHDYTRIALLFFFVHNSDGIRIRSVVNVSMHSRSRFSGCIPWRERCFFLFKMASFCRLITRQSSWIRALKEAHMRDFLYWPLHREKKEVQPRYIAVCEHSAESTVSSSSAKFEDSVKKSFGLALPPSLRLGSRVAG